MIISMLSDILSELDFAAMVLVFMLLGMAVAMRQAQKRDDFDWGDGFRDEANKISWTRAAVPASLCLSSWCLIYVVMNGMRANYDAESLVKVLDALWPWFTTYILTWAGTKSVDKLIDVFMEWVKGRKATP